VTFLAGFTAGSRFLLVVPNALIWDFQSQGLKHDAYFLSLLADGTADGLSLEQAIIRHEAEPASIGERSYDHRATSLYSVDSIESEP
jgi:hypothetical protein